jgi:hypothetical protein
MQSVLGGPIISRVFIAAATAAALALSGSALFQAPAPGRSLAPIGGAAELVSLVQGNASILWTSSVGPVISYEIAGWPTSDGDVELGGALMIERVSSDVGVIEFGERPMSLRFDFQG